MKRRQQSKPSYGNRAARTLALTTLVGAALPFLSACDADVNGALVIVQNQIPEIEEKRCVIPAKRDALRSFSGTYDIYLDQDYPYYLHPLVHNGLPPIAAEGQIEPNRIEYTGVEVQIVPPPGVAFPGTAACPIEFAFNDRASVEPEGDISSRVQVLLPCHARLLRDMFAQKLLPDAPDAQVRFRVAVRAVGRHAGSTIKSEPFEFSIRVCKGCLQRGFTGPYAAFDYPNGVPVCSDLRANDYVGNLCNPAQEAQILCCSHEGVLECPGRPRAPSLP